MSRLVIDQLLHGYQSGHSLLASSRTLPADIDREILSLSDLSGYDVTPAYEVYLTAYPLASIRQFAFAKTWYAEEMPRPGCVWTHTLLIPFDAFEDNFDPFILVDLHRRPQIGEYQSYGAPILEVDFGASSQRGGLINVEASRLVQSVYSSKGLPVFIETDNPAIWVDTILKLWQFQWPRLQRAFSFCTGSLSPRSRRGRPLSLQVVPRHVRLPEKSYRLEDGGFHQTEPLWAHCLADAMYTDDGLLEFLRTFGEEEPVKLSALPPLVEVFRHITARPLSLDGAIAATEQIARAFPSADSGTFLKRRILDDRNFSPQEECNALRALIMYGAMPSNRSEAFAELHEGIEERAFKLSLQDADLALSVLATTDEYHSPLSEKVQNGLAAGLEPFALISADVGIDFIARALRTNGRLAELPELWVRRQADLGNLVEALLGSENVRQRLPAVIGAIVMGKAARCLPRIVSSFGTQAIVTTLEFLSKENHSLDDLTTQQALTALEENPGETARWILFHVKDARTISGALLLLARWIYKGMQFSLTDLLSASEQRDIDLDILLVSASFRSKDGGAWRLLPGRFESLHQIAARQSLSPVSEVLLMESLPFVIPEHRWDICERLRVGLLRSFDQGDWPTDILPLIVEEEGIAQMLLGTYRRLRKDHSVSERLAKYFRSPEEQSRSGGQKKKKRWSLFWPFDF